MAITVTRMSLLRMRACDEIRRVPSEDNIARTAGGEGRLGFASSSEEGSVSGSWGWVKERTHLGSESWVGARFNSVQPRAQSQPQVQRFFAESGGLETQPSAPSSPHIHQGFFDGFNPRRRLPTAYTSLPTSPTTPAPSWHVP